MRVGSIKIQIAKQIPESRNRIMDSAIGIIQDKISKNPNFSSRIEGRERGVVGQESKRGNRERVEDEVMYGGFSN